MTHVYFDEGLDRAIPFCVCSRDDEPIEVVVTLPDGSTHAEDARLRTPSSDGPADDFYCAEYQRTWQLADPLGIYHVEFVQGGVRMSDEFRFVLPEYPAGIYFREDESLLLMGFQPHERITLVLWADAGTPVGADVAMANAHAFRRLNQLEMQADPDGMLLLNTDIGSETLGLVGASGEESGQVVACITWCRWVSIADDLVFGYASPTSLELNKCFYDFGPRLEVGGIGRVTFANGIPVEVRDRPGTSSSNVLAIIPEDTLFQVTDGPQCIDHLLWWEISSEDGHTGWVTQGPAGSLFPFPCLVPYQPESGG